MSTITDEKYLRLLGKMKAYCESKGLVWDEVQGEKAYSELTKKFGNDLDEGLLALFGYLTIEHVIHIMTPQNYTWKNRVMLALHFLFGKL